MPDKAVKGEKLQRSYTDAERDIKSFLRYLQRRHNGDVDTSGNNLASVQADTKDDLLEALITDIDFAEHTKQAYQR